MKLATKRRSSGKELASIVTISCLTLVGASLLTAEKTPAQLIPDASLGNSNSTVSPNVNVDGLESDRVDGGAIRGGNLFHSFSQFNVPEGRGVYFANPAAIDRILTRVTGGNVSQIFGTLGVLGNADLFLINPNGILFGPNARLDLNGSFIGSSANNIVFDNYNFSATNPETPPLVTINVPLGLQYGQNPGTIINRSTAGLAENPDTAGLGVKPGRTLALVGGDIFLEGGIITTGEGRIELGSVGSNSQVSLAPTQLGWYLGYKDAPEFRDIRLSQGAIVNGSGEFGSDIQVAGRNLALSEGSLIYYFNNGSSTGGDIAIRTAESIEMGGGLNPTTGNNTSIAIGVFGDGPGGNITIETSSLRTREGAGIASFTLGGEGNSGDVTVRAADFVELIGTDPSDPTVGSGLGSQVFSAADGGNVTVETRRLIIRDGASISSSTFGEGNSGDVTVRASESVELIGTNSALELGGGIAASAEPDATGNGGSITIETPRLVASDGAKITSATLGEGNAGSLTINATESIQLSGSAPGPREAEARRSGFFASTDEDVTGNAGSLAVNTPQLIIEEGAAISVTTQASGLGGDINLNVDRLRLTSGGSIAANSRAAGNGGTVTVNATDLVEVRGNIFLDGENSNSSLSTRAEGSGNAGSLNINTNRLRVTDTGQLTVSSTGTGNAGNLTVNARSLDLDGGASISADSSAGLGNVNLNIAGNLRLSGNSSITTNSTGDDPGGNINIAAGSVIARDNSDITANAENAFGGEVSVAANGIFGSEFRTQATDQSDITATSQLGASFSGNVETETPEADPDAGLVELPKSAIDIEQLVATDLCSPEELEKSSFVILGRGGLAPNPQNEAIFWQPLLEWAGPEGSPPAVGGNLPNPAVREDSPRRTIRQARGWVQTADGKVVLTAGTPVATSSSVGLFRPGGCR